LIEFHVQTDNLPAEQTMTDSRSPDEIVAGKAPSKHTPLVSVVIPCYQQAIYLREAVASVLSQKLTDYEILIVNDGSPDDTSCVALELIARHPERCIRLLEKSNGGLADARNAGIKEALGKYILPLDADDKLHPEMLRKTVAVLEADPQIAIAYTDVMHFGAVSRMVRAADYDFSRLPRQNHLNCCALFRREAWSAVGGYNPNMKLGYEDWDFWVSCGEKGYIGKRIPEPLLLYRVKDSSMYTTAVKHDAELRAQIVLNHPALFRPEEIVSASRLVHKEAETDTRIATVLDVPMVSVIVPTFNRPEMLRKALSSILAQTYENFEILVINDCGTDVRVVVEGLNNSGRIRYLSHDRNQGLSAARNTGLRAARGKYIAYLDDDDIYLPNHLDTLVRFLECSGKPVAYTDAYCLRLTRSEDEPFHETEERFVHGSDEWDNDRILYENFVPVLCFMHQRQCIGATGCFDESLSTHEDWEMWLRLSRRHEIVHIPVVTCEFRRNESVHSMTNSKTSDFAWSAATIYEKHKSERLGKRHILTKQHERLFNYIYALRKERRRGALKQSGNPLLIGNFGWQRYAAYWIHRKLTRPFSNLARFFREHLKVR